MSIRTNTTQATKASELADRVAMFLATGGQIKTTRTGRRGRTLVSQVHTPQVITTPKKRYGWEEALNDLKAQGLANAKVQRAIKAYR